MFIWDFFLALFIALFLTSIFAHGCKRCGPGSSILVFFGIIFLASWAGGLWIMPFGPILFGIYWFPFLFMGLLFALLLAAATPTERSTPTKTAKQKVEEAKSTENAIDVFIWILIIFLMFSIFSHYFWIKAIV